MTLTTAKSQAKCVLAPAFTKLSLQSSKVASRIATSKGSTRGSTVRRSAVLVSAKQHPPSTGKFLKTSQTVKATMNSLINRYKEVFGEEATSVLNNTKSDKPKSEQRLLDGALVTGGAGGVGFAMAREFASQGFKVLICDISKEQVKLAAETLKKEFPHSECMGVQCDVGSIQGVETLRTKAEIHFKGRLRVWVNNAGTNGGRVPLLDLAPEKVEQVVDTNLKGMLLTTQAALQVLEGQEDVHGHIFNVVGSGCRGEATPGYSAYGATKYGMMQLIKTLNKEVAEDPRLAGRVSVHNMSPGMVFTDLLLNDSTPELRKFFDVLASEPEEVAKDLVTKMLEVIPTTKTGEFVQFLTPDKIFTRMVNGFILGKKPGRFDETGNRVKQDGELYSENGVKIQFKSG